MFKIPLGNSDHLICKLTYRLSAVSGIEKIFFMFLKKFLKKRKLQLKVLENDSIQKNKNERKIKVLDIPENSKADDTSSGTEEASLPTDESSAASCTSSSCSSSCSTPTKADDSTLLMSPRSTEALIKSRMNIWKGDFEEEDDQDEKYVPSPEKIRKVIECEKEFYRQYLEFRKTCRCVPKFSQLGERKKNK